MEMQMQAEYKVGDGEETINIDALRTRLEQAHKHYETLANHCSDGIEVFEGFSEQTAKVLGWKFDNGLLREQEFGPGVVLHFCQRNVSYCARVAGFARWSNTEREQLERLASSQ